MGMRSRWLLAGLALLASGCGSTPAVIVSGGDPARGAAAVFRYGCGSCHTIASLPSAHGLVGPPLTGLRDRLYVAGMLYNSPENLQRWIRDPHSVNPGTAMPNTGVTSQDAADIAAFLYSK